MFGIGSMHDVDKIDEELTERKRSMDWKMNCCWMSIIWNESRMNTIEDVNHFGELFNSVDTAQH